jgi:hypothetical protein
MLGNRLINAKKQKRAANPLVLEPIRRPLFVTAGKPKTKRLQGEYSWMRAKFGIL